MPKGVYILIRTPAVIPVTTGSKSTISSIGLVPFLFDTNISVQYHLEKKISRDILDDIQNPQQ